jgi:RNA polymerase sigma factor for flagellar operon FliA
MAAVVQQDHQTEATAASDEEAALWQEFKAKGSLAARQQLFSVHSAFARNIARRHYREQRGGDLEVQDLYQHAYAGLLEALDGYDPAYGAPFRPYAARRISGSVLDGIMKVSEVREQLSWARRVRRERLHSLTEPGAARSDAAPIEALAELAMGLALGFMLEGTGLFSPAEEVALQATSDTAYDSLEWKETLARLHEHLAALPEREQTILRQHYTNGVGFNELATLLNVTKGRISQLHRAALLLLRKRLREHPRFGMVR